jgi:hypothetical protein
LKTKLVIGLVLMLIGTNLFTYATTRYSTTKRVLTDAFERVDAAIKKEETQEQYSSDRPPLILPIGRAVTQAGEMYYWWNGALRFWAVAVLLIASGVFVPFVESRRTNVA